MLSACAAMIVFVISTRSRSAYAGQKELYLSVHMASVMTCTDVLITLASSVYNTCSIIRKVLFQTSNRLHKEMLYLC